MNTFNKKYKNPLDNFPCQCYPMIDNDTCQFDNHPCQGKEPTHALNQPAERAPGPPGGQPAAAGEPCGGLPADHQPN